MRKWLIYFFLISLFNLGFATFDDTQVTCTSAGYYWMSGSITGSFWPQCCGDDYPYFGASDEFYNSTILCYEGELTTNADLSKGFCEASGYDWFTTEGTFSSRVDYTTGWYPRGIAAGDFDNDGWLDLVIGTGGDSQADVFINNGNGTFADRVSYSSNYPYAVAVGDFDNDGWLDFVTVTQTEASVFINDGDGTFAAKVDYDTGNDAESVAVGDFDDDGWLDFVTGDYDAKRVNVFINDGDGTFATPVNYVTGYASVDAVAVGDVDADGYVDIITSNCDAGGANSRVSVLINYGNGTFAPKVDYSTGTHPEGVSVADLDNDGWLDFVVVVRDSDEVSVFINDGDGTFTFNASYSTGLNPHGIGVADFNGDGWLDFVIANYGPSPSQADVFINDGDGTFADRVAYTTGLAPWDVAVGDFDNDGALDFVTADISNKTSVFLNNGLDGDNSPCCGDDGVSDFFSNSTSTCYYGNFDLDDSIMGCNEMGYTWISGGLTGSNGPCCGDDGFGDVFFNSTHMCSYGGVIFEPDAHYIEDKYGDYYDYTSGQGVCEAKGYTWFNTGFPTFFDTSVIGTYAYSDTLLISDVDNDGDTDVTILQYYTDGNLYVWENDGTPFTGAWTIHTIGVTTPWESLGVVGDLDNNGTVDLITNTGNDGDLYAWINDGSPFDAVWTSNHMGIWGAGFRADAMTLGDLDGDGDLDLLTGSDQTTQFLAWENDGSPFTGTWNYYNIGNNIGRVNDISVGDLDKDGDLDVVEAEWTGYVYIFENNGSVWGPWPSYLIGEAYGELPGAQHVSLGDLDKDGDLDIVMGDEDGYVYIFENNGSVWGPWLNNTIYTGSGWSVSSLNIADLDNDGDLDIISGSSSGSAILFENDGSIWGSWTTTTSSLGGAKLETSDFDLDGDLDFVYNAYVTIPSNSLFISENYLINGTFGPCCGDDFEEDSFTNGTHTCSINPDESPSLCGEAGYTWFTGTVTGSNGPCCGDDNTSDYFGNSSACCDQGVFNSSGACPFSPAGCLDTHVDTNNDYLWSAYPSDACGLSNCTSDGFAIDSNIDYVWDGYCYSSALSTTCTSARRTEIGFLPPFNTSFTVTVRGNLTEIGTELPVVGETIVISAHGVNYEDVTDEWGGWEVEVTYWELNCATSNLATASFSKDGKDYTASKSFTAVK